MGLLLLRHPYTYYLLLHQAGMHSIFLMEGAMKLEQKPKCSQQTDECN